MLTYDSARIFADTRYNLCLVMSTNPLKHKMHLPSHFEETSATSVTTVAFTYSLALPGENNSIYQNKLTSQTKFSSLAIFACHLQRCKKYSCSAL